MYEILSDIWTIHMLIIVNEFQLFVLIIPGARPINHEYNVGARQYYLYVLFLLCLIKKITSSA